VSEKENVRKRVCLKESERRRRRKKECRAVSTRSSHSLRERKNSISTRQKWARRSGPAPRPSHGGLRGEPRFMGSCALRIATGSRARESRKKKTQADDLFFFFLRRRPLSTSTSTSSPPQPQRKKREDTSTPPPAFAPVPPPPHPTYDLLASIRAALEEDAGDVGDLTTQAT
jgi:hypothetical protein